MFTFAQKPEATTRATAAKSAPRDWSHSGRSREVNSAAHPQRTVGNRAAQRTLESNAEALEAGLDGAASPRFAHDSSRARARATSPARVQAKLMVNEDEAGEYMNAHDVAFDLAVLMDKARRSGSPYVKLEFEHYGKAAVHSGPLSKFAAGEIRRIALILRNYLPDQAAGVNTILVNFRFEQAVVQEEIRLPGWVAP